MSINLKEHIFSYRTNKKNINGTIFFKNGLGGGKDFFLRRQMQKSRHLGISVWPGNSLQKSNPR